ncbi:MAG: BspA family leucine-rich repeat surface protein, partial [Muribaculaceae bacterium]|nr:BspA family leucine-rich repeat surface protein [Muribaculaceae bacterium]
TYDGQNHTISGIRVYKDPTNSGNAYKNVALFGRISGATIQNVILTDARITGYRYVGGLVGNKASGTVQNCLVVGSTITCGNTYGGALFGSNSGTLTANHYRNCTVNNTTNATNVGVGNGSSSNDMAGARSVHALTLGTDITATGESVVIDGTTYYASNTTVTLGYSGTVPAGQMPVYSVNGTAIEGNTFTMPTNDNATVSATFVSVWSGSGTSGSPYVITTTAQLDALAAAVKSGETYSGTYFVLGNDIAYSTIGLGDTDENFTTIGGYFNGGDKNFSGTFDGQGHTISGIRLYKTGNSNPSKNQGLFGRISGATIKNVILTDARITGYRYVGGIVGNKASGTVQNCLVLESTITCENTYVGALFGGNSGTITANHYHGCTVNGTANATNVGVGGNGGTSSSSDKNGARSAHILTLGENVTATGESVTYQGTTYYASTTTVTLGYDNLPAGYTVTYTLNGTALTGNTFTMPANDNATVDASTALITYNITYDLDGGSVATANPTTYNVTTPTFTLNNPTKAGYTFTGWTGSNGTTPQTTVTIAQGSTGDLNYTAQWSLNTYNITYDLGGGSVATANPTTYNVQTPTFTLTNPTRAACNFDGWTGTDLTEPTMTVTIAQGSTGDRDYTAHWTQYAFTLTLGTDITASGTVAFTLDGTDYYFAGTEITLAYGGTIPEGQHLVFKVNGNAIEGDTFEMPAADVVVDAVLLERYYTFNSTTGVLALLWGEFNKDNKWGSEVTSSAVTRVTATDEVSFTGDCSELFSNFTNCTSMDLGNVNTDALNNTFRMFDKCLSLLSLEGISDWDVSNVTNMIAMFRDCWSLSSLDLSDWNTANVTNMSSMFAGSGSLTTIYVGTGWNTESVTSTSYMFQGCSSLQSLDLSGWNTANVTDMQYMFYGCSGIQSLNVSGWNTANVTNMSGMFEGCSGLQSLDLSGWNTANVTNMSGMFEGCSGLQSLDLSGWNTANVTDMSYMFYS